ncbi:tyrosine protein kinase [Ligilactobacillus pabuli]|uniref:Tyrosine-protein kinase CpsD n=1 Tax=Ligilactobacillus pabuli TaxID=2886039 RepID=A0ABQ5JKT3_9LACO|nr:CpsD/CapB family tyrosine-protein kinase [Ligilactobacillus pabuli]GKS82323.1 tyrosine protein kinase [Ligilactobacillus pabuli]
MDFFKKKKVLDTDSMENGVQLVTVSEPKSMDAEQFNTIRTNIQFSGVDSEIKSLMLTSATASDGKSTVAANIAASFAKQGKRTLLVDADMRRPTLEATFKTFGSKGLSNYLTQKDVDVNEIIKKTTLPNLFIITSGPIPPNPSELMGSKKMNALVKLLRDQLDIVIFDAPPILSVTDGQILANKIDGTILVVRQNCTEKSAIVQAVDLIKQVNGKILGAIINDVEKKDTGYYGYYGKKDNSSR